MATKIMVEDYLFRLVRTGLTAVAHRLARTEGETAANAGEAAEELLTSLAIEMTWREWRAVLCALTDGLNLGCQDMDARTAQHALGRALGLAA